MKKMLVIVAFSAGGSEFKSHASIQQWNGSVSFVGFELIFPSRSREQERMSTDKAHGIVHQIITW